MALNQELYQRVIEDYAKTQSVERTAKNCHCARVTAQKVLITEGLWSSRTSIAVGKLLAEGRSVREIAGELHLTEKALPYIGQAIRLLQRSCGGAAGGGRVHAGGVPDVE